jgi:hypothetical protein
MKLDGTEKITPASYDSHERVARVAHEEAPKQPGYAHSGLQPKAEEVEAEKPVEKSEEEKKAE